MELSLPKTKAPYLFQREGIELLVSHGYGFLWDEPGLGKTLQAIVAAHNLGTDRPILVVCPNSLKRWWVREIQALYPQYKGKVASSIQGGRFCEWTASGRGGSTELLPHYYFPKHPEMKWYVTHYTGVRICKDSYSQVDWGTVILDEAHYIKNPQAARTGAILSVTPKDAFRIGLTATPWGKSPADLWAQLHWMSPDIKPLDSYWRWFYYFVEYEEETNAQGRKYKKIIGGKNLEQLAQLMSAYGLQRVKREVAPQLPQMDPQELPLPLEGRQEKVYKALESKDTTELAIGDTSESKDAPTRLLITNVLARLIKMQQWLSCPWDFDPGTKGVKMEWLEEWMPGNHYPAVIATHFKSTASYITKYINSQEGLGKAALITGDVPLKIRDSLQDKWREGEYQYIVGTISALGTGLNLQYAWTMVFYDQLWDPILMEQAMHRIHRIDLDHPIDIILLYVEGTSNELVLESFQSKWDQMRLVKEFLVMLRTGGLPGKEDTHVTQVVRAAQ